MEEFAAFAKSLDKSKNDVSFVTLMDFVTKYSKTSEYPDINDLCRDIAEKLLEEKKTMANYANELRISSREIVPVKFFIDTVMAPYSIGKKSVYYFYYTLKGDSNKGLVAENLIDKVDTIRADIERDRQELFGDNDEGNHQADKSEEKERTKEIIKPEITIKPVLEIKKEPTKKPSQSIRKDNSKVGGKSGSKVGINKSSLRDNRSLPLAVVEFYNLLLAPTAKRRMNEKMVFKILDTDGNGMVTRQEFLKGINKLRIKFTPEQVAEIFDFADTNREGNISTEEFMEMVQIARERIATQETNKLTEACGKTPEQMYDDALTKIKLFALSNKDAILNYDYKVIYRENLGQAVVPTVIFEASLRDYHIGLSEQEIKLVTHMADQNKDEMLDEEEFGNYLKSIDIQEIPSAFERANLSKPEKPLEKGPPPELIKNIEILKASTNFGRIANPSVSAQMLAQVIETPYPHFELDPHKHFLRIDKKTGKYKMTIVRSRKAAILW